MHTLALAAVAFILVFMGRMIRGSSIAARLFVLQVAFITVLTIVATVWLFADARTDVDAEAASKSMTVATSIADNPFVLEQVTSDNPTALLEPYAVDLMRDTRTDFITIMTPDRTRLTHPDPAEIGKQFLGTVTPALRGEAFTETYSGTLGPSVRAVVPIEDAAGRVVAIVAAGVTVDNISAALGDRLTVVLVTAALTILLGAVAAWLLSRYLRRVTWGRGPEELARMFAYYEGVLHSVREGLVLVDADGRLLLYNDQAAEFLGLPFERPAEPIAVRDLDLPKELGALLAGGHRAVDEVYFTATNVLVVNQEVTVSSGPARVLGTVTTLRDHTDLQKLTGELQTMRTLSDALRSQTHEFSNRLHTIVALIELGRTREAIEFAANELDVGQELADSLLASIDEPVLTALLLGKSAQARERAIEFELRIDETLGRLKIAPSELVTIVGNLVDNALDAAGAAFADAAPGAATDAAPDEATDGARNATTTGRPRVLVEIERGDSQVTLRISDNGGGFADVDLAFSRGYSTKTAGEFGRGVGLALVDQAVRRLRGTVEARGTAGPHGPHGAVVTVRLPLESAVVS